MLSQEFSCGIVTAVTWVTDYGKDSIPAQKTSRGPGNSKKKKKKCCPNVQNGFIKAEE